jgi:hypothetical protein
MVAERLVDLICLIVVIALTILTQMNLVGSYALELTRLLEKKFHFTPLIWTLIITTIVLVVVLTLKLFNVSRNHPKLFKVKEIIKGMLEGLLSIRKVKSLASYIFYTVLIWFCYLISIRIGFYGMPSLSELGWIPSLSILTFGSFAMIATQGGIGAYQLAIQKTLTLYQIDQVSGLAFGWLLWLVQTLILFLIGPLSVLMLYLLNKKHQKQT